MGLHSHANTRDANEPEIVEIFRKFNASVWRLDTPFDLVVGHTPSPPALIAEIRGRHLRAVSVLVGSCCEMCSNSVEIVPWPCDAIRAVEIIERLSGPRTYPVEVKSETGKLTPLQQAFWDTHRGDRYIARRIEDAPEILFGPSAIVSKACR